MRTFSAFSVTLLLGLAHAANAQESRLPYGPLASAIARQLRQALGSTSGAWALDATPTCRAALRSPVCTFRTPSPESNVIPLVDALAREFDIVASATPLNGVLATRMANFERARSAGHLSCGERGVDDNLVKLVSVGELRSAGDTTEATVYVAQYGKVAYCAGGSQGYSFTAIARANGGHDFIVRKLAHFEVILEIPKRSN